MHRRRRRTVTAVITLLVVATGVLALRAARPERTSDLLATTDWQPLTWYRLDDRGSIASCELPTGYRYRLVIGCLNDAAQEHCSQVELIASQPGRETSRRFVFQIDQPARRASEGSPANRDLVPSQVRRVSFETTSANIEPLPARREFFLHVTDGDLGDPKQYARIDAHSVACGDRVRVFADQQLTAGEVPQNRIDELVRMLETEVLPRVESQFGSLRDVDGDGRFTVVLTPWLSRLQGGRTSIGGMVRSSDFQRDVPPPLGNRSDMLFLNSSLPSDSALRDLLSHEVAHAACISQRLTCKGSAFCDEDDWLSEALAHLAELGSSNIAHRLTAFLDDPPRYPLVVPDYYRAGLWRNPGCRGATFLFTRWCVDRHGPDLIRRLAQSTERGTRNLERATGRRFEELFREWSLTLATGELHRASLSASEHKQTLTIRGTAFAVVDVPADKSGPQTLRIAGDSGARWQFSILPLPENPTAGETFASQR